MTKDFELVKSIVDGTDWDLLKKQKTALINMTYGHGQEIHNLSSDQIDRFQGIVNWIEAIQDKIVELGYKTEAEVYCTEAGT